MTDEHRQFVGKPQYEEVVRLDDFGPVRFATRRATTDRTGRFSSRLAYKGWEKSMYDEVWFDSSTERALALILDDANEVRFWVRLHTGDLKILWQSDGREYNPDFVAVEKKGTHWLIETKMNKEMPTADVKGKETAAQRWANHVSADKKVDGEWRYLGCPQPDETGTRSLRRWTPCLRCPLREPLQRNRGVELFADRGRRSPQEGWL